jgi:hypothetical protein
MKLLCLILGHDEEIFFVPKPTMWNPRRRGRRLLQKDDALYECRRCGRVRIN